MIITIASGKGGTGKTTIATNLALSASSAQYLDCDVEEPNGHMFLKPTISERREVTIPIPEIDEKLCDRCGQCAKACEFNALAVIGEKVMFFAELCHGCGTCTYVCPKKAIHEGGKEIGCLELGHAGLPGAESLLFAQGISQIGNPLSPPVIKQLKKLIDPERFAILDAPPGTSCPMVQTMLGSDYCLFVTEPTPFGLNDLKLAVGVARQLQIPCGIVINRSDSGDDEVVKYCNREKLPILLEIPFNRDLAFAYSRGLAAVISNPDLRKAFVGLYEKIVAEVSK
ncbi:MAG TPA: (4Fe-4S)-binding protein [Proteobacteria bacterium]|nr:(4Fe-4S)-binding protein [Pseudomonadota bacterium]